MTKAAKWSIGVFMALGLYFFLFGVWFVYEAVESTSWPQVEGKITNTSVIARSSRSGNSKNYSIQYIVKMYYQYQVDGITYNQTRFSLGSGDTVEGGFNEKQDAKEWLKNSPYKIGKPVTIYVKPGDPEETVISSGLNWGTYVPLIIGALFFFTPLLLMKFIKLPQKQT
ncbi:MAG TPA: DUF3592 domain-containing protein [Gammaproteobacteria bacterium]|nr:DUF3592 domain-containing protein [Xanthomonadales bacterium]MCB1595118.1 DUF3592 domain-containing protein [Xanthomonadales bacterium]HOP22811.1 DUF3592 domain-containing protein [Gammaproteobacteria bacterium]HPI96735.1 DUF3592 domain-containing protein [Gammaproteobacteria bacterium]HPQ88237.1 DUF3592 domain-containing protein [Gammaproteobacteria bacterium]